MSVRCWLSDSGEKVKTCRRCRGGKGNRRSPRRRGWGCYAGWRQGWLLGIRGPVGAGSKLYHESSPVSGRRKEVWSRMCAIRQVPVCSGPALKARVPRRAHMVLRALSGSHIHPVRQTPRRPTGPAPEAVGLQPPMGNNH